MAKKFVKFLLFVTATCAVAAGVYYFFNKKQTTDWDDEDFDEYDEEEDDEYDDFDTDFDDRIYVSLNQTAPTVKPQETKETKEAKAPAFTEEYFDTED